jgi:hypothetical protein
MLVLLTVIGSISGIATAMLLWPLGWLIALTCMPLGASLAVALAGFALALMRRAALTGSSKVEVRTGTVDLVK